MDTPILKWCQCCGAGTFQKDPDINLTTNPCTWESVADLCSSFWRCLNSAGPCGQCLIVHLSFPGTHVRIDIGNVKAAGVLCILGISFGIGTYVLCKIYNRFIRPSIRRKPSSDSTVHEEDRADVGNVCWLPQSHEENMGSQYSLPTDIPVYYKPGFGVSLKRTIDGNYQLRKRKSNVEFRQCDCGNLILEGNLQSRNSIISLENSYEKFGIKGVNNNENSRQGRVRRAPSLSRLHIAVDESGFVEDDGNGDKSSLKGNFSPASLCEKNLQLFTESGADLEIDGRESQNCPKLDIWKVNRYLKTGSVLLSPTKDEISSSISEAFASSSEGYSVRSSKSDASEICSELAEPSAAEPFETDDDREQLSPLPYDVSPPKTPNKLFTKKLKLKLGEISSQFLNKEVGFNHSSPSSATDSYSVERKRIDGTNVDRENSISGISSPELELLHNENTEEHLAVNTNTFNKIEDEIHVVEDEFENISKEIHALSSKYSSVDFELKRISQSYHSISALPKENSESTDSQNVSETEDDIDLSWEHENLMSQLYSETSESHPLWNNRSMMNLIKEPLNNASSNDSVSQDLSLPSHLINCSVEIDGSLYEDEFHLQLGTKAIPKLKEPPLNNVSEKYVISEYAVTEWKGATDKAKLMRQAYKSLPDHCHCCHLRRIRGDNYCGIRSTLYQALVNGLPTFNLWASREKALEELSLAYNNQSSWICQWNFANRLSFSSQNLFEVMQHCVSTLYAKLDEITLYSSYSDRDGYIEKLLNSDPKCDLELMEGVKLLMSLSAFHLHSAMELGKDVPVFSWLMFARDTSETVASFVKNHLNAIGDSGGLEQVEMCLLGYTLGVRIRVYRLQQYSQEDFISHYPEDGTDTWPVVSLIAEDDRHYNIPVV